MNLVSFFLFKFSRKMSDQEFRCCLCKEDFSVNSQPRMMPYCEHSACTPCLKKIIVDKTASNIKCHHCGHEENLQEADLEYFPKNISLSKILKEIATNKPQIQTKKQPSCDLSNPNQSLQLPQQMCLLHNKQLQIICITDKEKLCPHCALFGKHKNHAFKTICEVNTQIKERKDLFEEYRRKKANLDNKIASKEFKDGLLVKIGTEKQRVISEIKSKFAVLLDNVRLAEKQAYDDVAKSFKGIIQKIRTLLKEENECQIRYRDWEQRCSRLFSQAELKRSLEQKVSLYFGGPLQDCKKGDQIIKEIQQKINGNLQVTEKLIMSIKVVQDTSIKKSIFNYLNVSADTDDIEIIAQTRQEIIQPRNIPELSPTKLEFSSADSLATLRQASHFASSIMLSTKRHSTPQKRSSSKQKNLNRTSEKRKVGKSPQEFQKNRNTLQKMIEQFCGRQNVDTLDLSSYNLSDTEILDILKYVRPIKKIKGLKLVKNNLTNEGLARILQLIPGVTNLNLSFNLLGDQSLGIILSCRHQVPLLRIINISNNKINQRRVKPSLEQLKRQGIIVTI